MATPRCAGHLNPVVVEEEVMQFTGVVGRGTGGDRRGGAGGGILARFRRLLTKGFIRGEKLEKHTSKPPWIFVF